MEIKDQLEVYERACLAYANHRRTDDPLGCDRAAMAAAFLTIMRAFDVQIVSVTYEEGGEWKPANKQHRPGPIHAFKCTNGRIWDIWNGWRT